MSAVSLTTLKKRSDFLRLRGGRRCQSPAFVLETKPILEPACTAGPRFGFTITKKIGNAVVRNRIRRRLKHAVAALADDCAHPDHDYVLIARRAAATQPFEDLKKDLERCFQRVHDPERTHRRLPGSTPN